MKENYQLLKGVQYTPERDKEIGAEVLQALKTNWQLNDDTVRVTVIEGSVILDGEMPLNYQNATAAEIIGKLSDVKSVTNNLIIQPDAKDKLAKMEIENSLKRNWSVGHSGIHVHVFGKQVILSGSVNSVHERKAAEQIARKVSGIVLIKNDLKITDELGSSVKLNL